MQNIETDRVLTQKGKGYTHHLAEKKTVTLLEIFHFVFNHSIYTSMGVKEDIL